MLTDRFGRSIEYLRLSVTDRCDLRCSYCIPKGFKNFEEPENWLTFAEIERVVAAFTRLGTRRVRLTGGEPLLRRNLTQLAAKLGALPGLHDLSMTTNATQLTKYADALHQAGVRRLNISLDSLRSDCIADITGRDSFQLILDGIMAAKKAGFFPIKLNMVMLKGVNENDIEPMVAFCVENGFVLRLIEAMPMGETGQSAGFLNLHPLLKRLQERHHLKPLAMDIGGGPASYWGTEDGSFTLGLITPISQHFCAACNRVRLSVDGVLYMCLGQEEKYELRPMLRAGCSDDELEQAIRDAIELKPEKHEFIERPSKVIRIMSQTGG